MVSCNAFELMCIELMKAAGTDQECYSRESGLYQGIEIGIMEALNKGIILPGTR